MSTSLEDAAKATAPLPQLATTIAETVGSVLAEASDAGGRHEDAEEIRVITQAMVRLVIGVPLRSDGQLTIKSLAVEATLRRNKLTHKHTDLKDLFYALVRAQSAAPRVTTEVVAETERLNDRIQKLTTERDRWQTEAKQFARVVQVLEVENEKLRTELEARTGIVDLAARRHRLAPSEAIGPTA